MKALTNLIFEPKGRHDPDQAYKIKDTVMSEDGTCVYFALQDVPAGTALDNAQYWIKQIDLSGVQGPQGEKGETGEPGMYYIPSLDSSGYLSFESSEEGGESISFGTSLKGPAGANGTSVKVSEVSISGADGGVNKVIFSDGKTLEVKNGSKGSTGAQGPQGEKGNPGTGIASITIEEV